MEEAQSNSNQSQINLVETNEILEKPSKKRSKNEEISQLKTIVKKKEKNTDEKPPKPKNKKENQTNKKEEPETEKKPKNDTNEDQKSNPKQIVLNYLKEQNKPYNIQILEGNMHKIKIKKKQLEQILEELLAEDLIYKKEVGRINIFCYNQNKLPKIDKQDLKDLQNQLDELKEQTKQLTNSIKNYNIKLAYNNSQLTTEQIKQKIEILKQKIVESQHQLEIFESGNYDQVSDEIVNQVNAENLKARQLFVKKRGICMEGVSYISDLIEKSNKEVLEMLGIDITNDFK